MLLCKGSCASVSVSRLLLLLDACLRSRDREAEFEPSAAIDDDEEACGAARNIVVLSMYIWAEAPMYDSGGSEGDELSRRIVCTSGDTGFACMAVAVLSCFPEGKAVCSSLCGLVRCRRSSITARRLSGDSNCAKSSSRLLSRSSSEGEANMRDGILA